MWQVQHHGEIQEEGFAKMCAEKEEWARAKP